jgi:hypothetical protein
LDGTNNAGERAIGWWVKERYRSMRGDQRADLVRHGSRRIAAMGNALDGPGFALAEVIASRAGEGGERLPSSLNQALSSHPENQPIWSLLPRTHGAYQVFAPLRNTRTIAH